MLLYRLMNLTLKILNDYLVKYETNYKILYKPHPYGRIKIPKKKLNNLKI